VQRVGDLEAQLERGEHGGRGDECQQDGGDDA
jgi:hypothetical protein